jgi:large subunit ribosomal protein L24
MEKEIKKVNVRVGDEVVVITGKDIGKKGKITAVNPETNRCIVTGVNMIIKHKKARSQAQKSERKRQEGSIDISNVQIVCSKCGKATRVGSKEIVGVKHRICKKCGEILDKKYVKPKTKDKTDDRKEEAAKTEKKPLVRREIKHTAESVIKKPNVKIAPSTKLPRKMGGE